MAIAASRKNKGNSISFDIEKTRRDDTMEKFFEALANEDTKKYIKKSDCIDDGFSNLL